MGDILQGVSGRARTKFCTILRGTKKVLVVVGRNAPLVALQSPAGERTPLFMVGSYPYFIEVVKQIALDRSVLALFFREDALSSQPYNISLEATAHVRTIVERQPKGPYMVGGFSSGGLVAYEAAQQLRALGHEVGLLVLIDTPNWNLMPRDTPQPREMRTPRRRRKMFDTPDWYLLPKAGIRAFIAAGRVALERMRTDYIPRDQVELAAALEYRPAPYSGRVLLVKRHRGLPFRWRFLDPGFGWSDLVSGALEICVVEAVDHLDIFESNSDRELVVKTMRRCFNEVDASRAVTSGPVAGASRGSQTDANPASAEARLASKS